ncbi:hypothetical protein B0H11DRAFT_163346 [Mycena galericulata]|nr:hypothetical protein B0H11DRAFT_163346 [Mycena galericulata]
MSSSLRTMILSKPAQNTSTGWWIPQILTNHRRFRILLIGRSGVGKSALINAVFGGGVATEEHGRQPSVVPDINHEFSPPNNPRLVLHDSQGFLPGNVQNFDKVLNFIRERGEKPKLEDRLHVIWLCTELPISDRRCFHQIR